MKSSLYKISLVLWNLIIALIAGFTIYFLIRYGRYGVDIKTHNFFLEEYLENGFFPIPPGYYALIYLLDLLVRIKYPFVVSSLLTLTFFIWWKYTIVFKWLQEEGVKEHREALGLSLALIFFGPLVFPPVEGDFWYLGKFTPSIWHNSTLIAVFPFSLILFRKTMDWWKNYELKFPWNILGLSFAIILIKPSFLFCYIPLFPLFSGYYHGFRSRFFGYSIGISVGLLAVIWLEKILIYNWDPMVLDYFQKNEIPQIQIRPLKVWLHYAFEPFWDFFSSFSLTVLFLIFWGRKAFQNQTFVFSFALLVFAILIYLLLAETGFREWHANFYWQIPITYLIHLIIMVVWVYQERQKDFQTSKWKFSLFYVVFSLHVLSGVAYWARIFSERIIS
ncbi:MAG: hypothetical protein HWE15_10850 [Algoriphagus sp.]|uniref:hypothetical protein n=1 Tax=Algoriphagus sp. TaxID=1872435 RepID=UPI0017C39821|nr:hypothetical protein [Algoriphagus sp.]NVJ86794.1 hypothetical protein [Algoriphagus sp.]